MSISAFDLKPRPHVYMLQEVDLFSGYHYFVPLHTRWAKPKLAYTRLANFQSRLQQIHRDLSRTNKERIDRLYAVKQHATNGVQVRIPLSEFVILKNPF